MNQTEKGNRLEQTPSETVFFSNWLEKSFGRVVSQGRLIPVIDGLRFVAIMAVIMHHLNGFVTKKTTAWEISPRDYSIFHIFQLGNCGVPLFFTLSGFILGMPFLERIQSQQPLLLKQYYTRRITRLEPPFIVNILLIAILLVVWKKEQILDLLPHLLATLVYLHGMIYEEWSTINGVSWSLEIEVQFYLLAPILAMIVYRGQCFTRRLFMIVLIATSIGIKYRFQDVLPRRVMLSLPYFVDFFLVGMLLADVYLNDWKKTPKVSLLWDICGIGAWSLLVLIQWNPVTYFLLPVATFAAYWCSFKGKVMSRLLSQPVIVITGGMCYTIYLYHFFVISFVGNQTISWTAGWSYPAALLFQAAIILPIVLFVSLILFKCIERPFMIWRPFANPQPDLKPTPSLQQGVHS